MGECKLVGNYENGSAKKFRIRKNSVCMNDGIRTPRNDSHNKPNNDYHNRPYNDFDRRGWKKIENPLSYLTFDINITGTQGDK